MIKVGDLVNHPKFSNGPYYVSDICEDRVYLSRKPINEKDLRWNAVAFKSIYKLEDYIILGKSKSSFSKFIKEKGL